MNFKSAEAPILPVVKCCRLQEDCVGKDRWREPGALVLWILFLWFGQTGRTTGQVIWGLKGKCKPDLLSRRLIEERAVKASVKNKSAKIISS